jgi:hypothetical protein
MAKSAKTKEDEATEPDEDETTTDETPKKSKKNKKGKGKKGSKKGDTEAKQSRASSNGKVGTQEIVKHVNENGLTEKPIDGRQLRMVLRKHRGEKGIDLDSETGRWEWDSMDAGPVKAILGFVKAGEVEATKQEGLARLKENKDAKADTKETKKDKKKGKKNKKNKA